MKTNFISGVMLPLVFLASLLGFSNPVASQEIEARVVSASPAIEEVVVTASKSSKESVTVASQMKYTVRPGDTLSVLARRFNTTIDELASKSLNPVLAQRGNLDLIFAGEVIQAPVYVFEEKGKETILPNELVVMSGDDFVLIDVVRRELLETQASWGRLDAQNRLAEEKIAVLVKENSQLAEKNTALTAENASFVEYNKGLRNLVLFVVALSLITLIFAVLVLKISKSRTKEKEVVHAPPATLEGLSPEEILQLLRTAPGRVLIQVNDLPIWHDERKNPVTLKKIREVIEKRQHLLKVPVKDWPTPVNL